MRRGGTKYPDTLFRRAQGNNGGLAVVCSGGLHLIHIGGNRGLRLGGCGCYLIDILTEL